MNWKAGYLTLIVMVNIEVEEFSEEEKIICNKFSALIAQDLIGCMNGACNAHGSPSPNK